MSEMVTDATTTELPSNDPSAGLGPLVAVVLAGLVGLGLLIQASWQTSATYDEVAYLRIAARWYRTGDQAEITRMGSPLTFWKLQQGPVLWVLDRLGREDLIDEPIRSQATLLPIARMGALWVWAAAFVLTVVWARRMYGACAMGFAAWLFVLSPNLLAHGGLLTMEMPLVAATTAVGFLFWRFLETGRPAYFAASAAACGLAFSCKFTAVVFPPLLGVSWWVARMRRGERWDVVFGIAARMAGFLVLMAATDLLVTGFATLPLSTRPGQHHPSLGSAHGGVLTRLIEARWPQDLVGFVTQMRHQRSGGSSYLLGERRLHGWWYYYFVALAVKVPLSFGLLATLRMLSVRQIRWSPADAILPVSMAAFLALTALGSSRNYGVRYLLPLGPLAIVWLAGLAGGRGGRPMLAWACLVGQALAVASVHPYELTYFNRLAGGPIGGRAILADSNLDWGQGLVPLATLQRRRPELRDLTLYYFGDTDPSHYGVAGICHVIDAGAVHPGLPPRFEATTRYVAVSASLQFGPWGPDGYFLMLEGVRPVAMTDDTTIAIYRTRDVFGPGGDGERDRASIEVEAAR